MKDKVRSLLRGKEGGESITGRRYGTYGAVAELHARSVRESADFIAEHLDTALLFPERESLLGWAAKCALRAHGSQEWLAMEFGVATGSTLNLIDKAIAPHRVHGFDSFRGLPEDWVGWELEAGAFDASGAMPRVEENAKLVVGMIEDTLPGFLERTTAPIGLLHIDTDLYSSCKSILRLTKPRMTAGTMIVFDELHSYPGWKLHELRALEEELSAVEYVFAAFSNLNQAAVRIL